MVQTNLRLNLLNLNSPVRSNFRGCFVYPLFSSQVIEQEDYRFETYRADVKGTLDEVAQLAGNIFAPFTIKK